jgi:hypothetical protein
LDIVSAAKACTRRLYIFIPVLAVGVLLGIHGYQRAAPTYTAKNQLVVLPPAAARVPSATPGTRHRSNPYAASTTVAAASLQSALSAEGYDVTLGTSSTVGNELPIVIVTATARAANEASNRLRIGTAAAVTRFDQLQAMAGAPRATYLQLQPLNVGTPDVVTVGYPGRQRPFVGLIVAGLLLAVVLSCAVDGVVTRRRRAAADETAVYDKSSDRVAVRADVLLGAGQDGTIRQRRPPMVNLVDR